MPASIDTRRRREEQESWAQVARTDVANGSWLRRFPLNGRHDIPNNTRAKKGERETQDKILGTDVQTDMRQTSHRYATNVASL